MTMFPTARLGARGWHGRSHIIPIMLASLVGALAIALVAYLLWPTWGADATSDPERLPVSIGGTLFNIPTAAIRMKIQRHSGPQERIDLNFGFPSLDPPAALKQVGADAADNAIPPVDRIFLSIAAHQDQMAPDVLLRTIYPRYLDAASTPVQDGLMMRAFRDHTPYSGEDLLLADSPQIAARCTRDAATPGMCLSERRVDGADLTYRFPRSWLVRWRDVAGAMDHLTLQLHGGR